MFIRRPDLAVELNFHLTEYQTGRLGRLDEMNEPSRQVRKYHLATFDPSHLALQVVVGGEVIEYISMEMGVVKLAEGDTALFHLSQVQA